MAHRPYMASGTPERHGGERPSLHIVEVRGSAPAGSAARVETIPLTIHHGTTHPYREPMSLEPHRRMLRPREPRLAPDLQPGDGSARRGGDWGAGQVRQRRDHAAFILASTPVVDSVTRLDLNAAA